MTKLLWFQDFQSVEDAIQREKSLKRWLRQWKVELIDTSNPDWHDLYSAMAKYEPKGPLSASSRGVGPRVGAVGLTPTCLPEDDSDVWGE